MAIKSAFEQVTKVGGLSQRNFKAYHAMNAVSNYVANQGHSIKQQVEQTARQQAQQNTVDKDTSRVMRKTAIYSAPIMVATVGSLMAVENYKHAMQRNYDAVSNLGDRSADLSQKLEQAGMVQNPDLKDPGLNSVFGGGDGPTVLSAGGDTYSSIGRMTSFNNGYNVTQIDMQGFAMDKHFSFFDKNGKFNPSVTLNTNTKDFVNINTVTNKGDILKSKELTISKRNEIANNLKGFESKVWNKFEPSSLGKGRNAFHYQVNGTILQVTNMNGEAKAAADMYNNLLRYNRMQKLKGKGDFLDKELKSKVEELRDAAKNLDKAKKQLKGMPKKFGKSAFRSVMAASGIEQSEAVKGGRLGMSFVRGGKVIYKAGMPIGTGLSKFAINTTYKGVSTVGNAILAKMGKNFRIPVFDKPLTEFIKGKIVALRRKVFSAPVALVGKLVEISPLGNTIIGKRIQNRLTYSFARIGGMDKELAKVALKAANKAVGKGVVGKGVQKIATKAANTAAGKVVGKVGRFAGKAVSGVTNVILAPFRFIGRALNQLKRAFGFILKKIIVLIMAIWAGLLLIEAAFGVLFALFGAEDDKQNYVDMYTASSIEEWNTKSQTIMDTLHSCHEDQMSKLSEMAQSYEVADIQYPAGEQENYKELFCGILVTCQYDISFYTNDELKDIAQVLYERTHIVTESKYNIDGYDGTIGENKACHIYMNIQRGTSLAYSILDQSGYADIDLSNIVSAECDSADWMQVVTNVKKLMALNARTGAAGDHYYDAGNTGAKCWINLNGTNYEVRQDCSGYVSVCLQAYGSFEKGDSWGSSGFVSASSIPGFVKQRFNSWADCKMGDILCVYEGSYNGAQHHVEIFAGIFNGIAYVYNAGSDSSVINQGETVAGKHRFTTIWRPVNPGTVIDTGSTSETIDIANNAINSGIISDVTIEDYEPGDEIWPYGYYIDKEDINLPFSNVAAVEFDEETGNEIGYEDALKASIQAEIDSTKYFTNSNFTQNTDAHMVSRRSGTATVVNSVDFIRYIYAKHSVMVPFDYIDFFEEMDTGSLQDLKVGDIIIYIPHTSVSDSIASVKPINQLAGAEQVAVGDTVYTLSDSIYSIAIPMIYIGNNQAVGYGHDALAQAQAYSNPAQNPAMIRTYNVSDLDTTRILDVSRLTGFTIANTYGSTEYFEGWTDMNIARLYMFMNDTCWDTGSKVISDAEDFDVETAEDGTYTIDYSFYDKKQDMFNGNDVYYTSDHTDTFMNDMVNELICLYDERGILPSIGYTKAYVLSNNRTTEESLSGFNVFEILSDDSGKYSTTDKYRYNADGEATTTTKEYEKYSSLRNAIIELYIDLNGKEDLFKYDKSTDPAGSFTNDLNNWLVNGNITADEKTKMQERYNEVAEKLQTADQTAIRIKELEDELIAIEGSLNNIANESVDNFHVNHGGRAYGSSADTVRKAISDYNELANIINTYATYNPGYSIYTPNRRVFMERMNTTITNAKNNLINAYNYHSSHAETENYRIEPRSEQYPIRDEDGNLLGYETREVFYYENWSGVNNRFDDLVANTSAEYTYNKVLNN